MCSVPASTDVYLVLELQFAMSAFGAQQQVPSALAWQSSAAPETRAWARMRLFDMNGHLFADRWRLPLRELPIQPLLDERDYLGIQTVSLTFSLLARLDCRTFRMIIYYERD